MERDIAGHPAPRASQEDLPLTNLRVVELHAVGPVPFAGMLLREMGATVTRVSPPSDPGLGVNVAAEFDLLNRDKEALALDLKQTAGREALARRLAEADVLLEGFRPGVLERLDLAPADLLRRYPRLVVGRLSGWGDAGPLAARAGHDINYLALAGVLNAIGSEEQPMPPLNLVADLGGGAMHLLIGLLARLVRRGIDGRGGMVTTSICAGTVGLTTMAYGMLASGRARLRREANLLDGGAPFYRTYRCADGRFVAVGALEPKFYRELVDVTAVQLALEDQYREETWPASRSRFAAAFAGRSRDEWAAAALGRDCCLTPVLDFMEAAAHPHAGANGWFREVAAGGKSHPRPGKVIRFDTGA
jgi:alpha-methylacyl-CoA racemase